MIRRLLQLGVVASVAVLLWSVAVVVTGDVDVAAGAPRPTAQERAAARILPASAAAIGFAVGLLLDRRRRRDTEPK